MLMPFGGFGNELANEGEVAGLYNSANEARRATSTRGPKVGVTFKGPESIRDLERTLVDLEVKIQELKSVGGKDHLLPDDIWVLDSAGRAYHLREDCPYVKKGRSSRYFCCSYCKGNSKQD